jgi:sulfate adenylyltransferase (ADP) / ATP adenylyltransferase
MTFGIIDPTPIKEFQPQTSPLFPEDLVQTYLLLLAARQANKRLIAFYNCERSFLDRI